MPSSTDGPRLPIKLTGTAKSFGGGGGQEEEQGEAFIIEKDERLASMRLTSNGGDVSRNENRNNYDEISR